MCFSNQNIVLINEKKSIRNVVSREASSTLSAVNFKPRRLIDLALVPS